MVASEQAADQEWVRQEIAAALKAHRRKATIVAFSGDMDKLFAALTIAAGAAASGLETTVFFTFWGLAALRVPARARKNKSWLDGMLGKMIPAGCGGLPVSAMNFGGAGAGFFRWLMRRRNVQSVAEIMADAQELGVRMVACQMSLGVLGLDRDELMEGIAIGGVATYLADAAESTVTLFV